MSKSFSLLHQLKRKDKAAQKQFYLEYFDQLVRIPMRYVRSKNEAISILNDSMIKIYASVSKVEDDSKLIPWAAAVVRNTTLDQVRKKVRYNKKNLHLDSDAPVSIVNSTAIQSLAMEEIMKYVHSLDDKERIVFCMYAIDGYKHAEIAKELNISEGTSKWYLNQARTNLKSLLKQYIS